MPDLAYGVCEMIEKKSRSRNWCGPANMNFTASDFLRRVRVVAIKTTTEKNAQNSQIRRPPLSKSQMIYTGSLQTNVDQSFASRTMHARTLICRFVSVSHSIPLIAAVFSAMLGLIFMVKFMDEMDVVSRARRDQI